MTKILNSGTISTTEHYKKIGANLNIKMKSMRRAKNTATLSIVRSMTTSCRRRLGRNRTNLRILYDSKKTCLPKPVNPKKFACVKLSEKGRHSDVDIVLPQQTERPQDRDARVFAAFEAVDKAVVDLQATEDDDDAVEDIETVADVAEEAVRLDRMDTLLLSFSALQKPYIHKQISSYAFIDERDRKEQEMEIRYHYQELEDHFDGEDDAKNQVADLDRLGEPVRLVVVLDAHAEGVDQDAEEDEALKRVVVDKRLDVHLNGCQELSDAVVARIEPERKKSRYLVSTALS